MTPRRRHRLGAVLLAMACSTLADTPDPEECSSDAECFDGFVCAVDQGRCLPGNEAAPRAHLGFDIRERAAGGIVFRVEVDGCDCTIREEENIRELAVRRSEVSQLLFLSVFASSEDDEPLPATFELTQASRYGQAPSPFRNIIDYPTINDDTDSVVDTTLRWPRYHPLDIDPPRELLLWKVEPDGDQASRYLGIIPPQTNPDALCTVDTDCCPGETDDCDPFPNYCDTTVGECSAIGSPAWAYGYIYEPACDRGIAGDTVLFDVEQGAVVKESDGETDVVVQDANVRLRYDQEEPFGMPLLGGGSTTPCSEATCEGPDQYCDLLTGQCMVALAGRTADEGSQTTSIGSFETRVYTYCDAEPNAPHTRYYAATVAALGARPSVDYRFDATFFPDAPSGSEFRVAERFCVPDWGPPASLELVIGGQPRTLIGSNDAPYTCCDVGCLPATADDATTPPPPEGTCNGRTSTGAQPVMRMESHFTLDTEELGNWIAAECALPQFDVNSRAGSLTRLADCASPDAVCRVDDVALGLLSSPRRYDVRVESPVGSVLASGEFVLELGVEAPPTTQITLPPRVLITGVVDVDQAICARREAGAGCAAREAIVLAERLRMPGEGDDLPGPYFHSINTHHDPVAGRDGAFVLPLDPGGVYVLTALPAAGAEGGPSGFAVVDLRDQAQIDPTPMRLTLEEGVVVTLALDQFDQRTSVVPVDRGSYLTDGQRLRHPGREGSETTADLFIDLNREGECWTPTVEGPQGCKIRRLIPPGSDVARSQVGVVRFTARRSDQAGCPQRCPQAIPTP